MAARTDARWEARTVDDDYRSFTCSSSDDGIALVETVQLEPVETARKDFARLIREEGIR